MLKSDTSSSNICEKSLGIQLLPLKYNCNPLIKTKSELLEIRKLNSRLDASIFESKLVPNASTRLKNREKSLENLSSLQENSYTIRKESLKKKDMVNSEKNFSNPIYGIHRNELPKFFDIKEKIFPMPIKPTKKLSRNSFPEPKIKELNQTFSYTTPKNLFSSDLDRVEYIELKKNAYNMLEHFVKIPPLSQSSYLLGTVNEKKTKKSKYIKRSEYHRRKTYLIQYRMQSIQPIQKYYEKNKKIRTSGFLLN